MLTEHERKVIKQTSQRILKTKPDAPLEMICKTFTMTFGHRLSEAELEEGCEIIKKEYYGKMN